VNVPMPTVTRLRTPVPSAPERRERDSPPRPRGEDRERRFRRRRIALIAAVVVVLIAAAAVALALSGAGEAPPATGAAEVVPADVLAYVHLSTDGSRPAVRQAEALARRFPDYPLVYAAVINRLTAIVGGGSGSVQLGAGIRPWLGKEAALAVLDTSGASASAVIVLDVSDQARARKFVASAGARAVVSYDGVRVLGYGSGTELAFVQHYLVVGPDAGVRAAIAAGMGKTRSLAHDPAYERASAGEPAGRVLDAYLPAAGVRRLLEPQPGFAGAIGALLDRPTLEGTTLSVSATAGGADVRIHSALGASGTRARRSGSGASGFTPTLQSLLPAGSTLMLDVDGLDRYAPTLLRAAATAGFAGNVAPLLGQLASALASEGVNVRKVESIFGGETAVALSPGPSPALLIVARTSNQSATQSELASLEAPLTALFPAPSAGPGQIPGIADQQIGGVTVHELGLGPGLQLDYAVFDDLVVVSTSVSAIDQVAGRSHSLADEKAYKTALAGRPAHVSSVLFTDFRQLLSLGEQIGLTSSTRVRALLADLAKVGTIGLSSTSGESDPTTELHLEIP
jgi:hypothetical protein